MLNGSDFIFDIGLSKIECKLIVINNIQKYKNKFIVTYFDHDGCSNEFVLNDNSQNIKANDEISICWYKEKNTVLKYLTKIGVSPLNNEEYIKQLKYVENNKCPDIFDPETRKMLNLLTVKKTGFSVHKVTCIMVVFYIILCFAVLLNQSEIDHKILFLFDMSVAIGVALIVAIRNKVYFMYTKFRKLNIDLVEKVYDDFDKKISTQLKELLKHKKVIK
jgi:hypothetical protein